MTPLLAVLTSLLVAAPAIPGGDRQRVIDDAFAITVPAGFADDHSDLGDNGVMITLSAGDAALVLTFYRPKAVSGPRTALKRHLQALRGKLVAPSVKRAKFLVFNKRRSGHELIYRRDNGQESTTYMARLVSGSAAGYVVVASWSWPLSGDGPTQGAQLGAVVSGLTRR